MLISSGGWNTNTYSTYRCHKIAIMNKMQLTIHKRDRMCLYVISKIYILYIQISKIVNVFLELINVNVMIKP